METGYSWDTGLLRKLNEDSILCTTFDIMTHAGAVRAGLFIVADGMGGHNAGEIASDLAIKTFHTECLAGMLAPSPAPPMSIMAIAFKEANSSVLEAASDRSLHGMGTTFTAALIIEDDMYIAHVGDSRCYIINSRESIQATKDHSMVQQLVDAGVITQEQARNHPRRNEITRVLGYAADSAPDLLRYKLYAGDNILICSDGLCGVLTGEQIRETVLNSPDPNRACADLTAQANLAGGPDNISVIIIKPANLPSWQAVVTAQTSVRIA
ncbi:MAG: Stp1/IreP family PP2C-type Ser/Thr phosphatase [Dehalococcoidia bacterium]|nr:Stp1/IreP family PP2C-type Ser/Thr phosphatase [Dehalococcoidia bacterium]MDD5493700.1 Stp1/IreP family PP2C-type Ser/Thr phosphatase [Dehalococcoidia bacterium]